MIKADDGPLYDKHHVPLRKSTPEELAEYLDGIKATKDSGYETD